MSKTTEKSVEITVHGGVVTSVKNLPDGYIFRVIDLDVENRIDKNSTEIYCNNCQADRIGYYEKQDCGSDMTFKGTKSDHTSITCSKCKSTDVEE